MDRIYAPWRSEYVTNPEGEGCIFCRAAESKDDRANFVLKRYKKTFVLVNLYPYNNGHIMIAPYKHTGDFQEITVEVMNEIMKGAKEWQKVIREAMNPDGFNLGINLGRAAGAGFEDHIHLHIVPRWEGDTNFMSSIAGAKVIPMSMEEVYEKLKGSYEREFEN